MYLSDPLTLVSLVLAHLISLFLSDYLNTDKFLKKGKNISVTHFLKSYNVCLFLAHLCSGTCVPILLPTPRIC